MQNFIAAHTTYNKDREQSSLTLKQVTQTNKRFLALIEDRKTGIHTVKALDKALNEPVRFISHLRTTITSSLDERTWNSKEARVWTGIAKNLKPLCLEEERETTRRSQENKLFQLELRILDLTDKFHKPGRYLICQSSLSVSSTGRVHAGSPTSTLRNGGTKVKMADTDVVLMNDMLLLLKKSKRHKGMFEFKSMHPLSQVHSAESGSSANELRVVFADTTLSLRFDTQAEADKWLSEIRQHVPNSGELTERVDRESRTSPSRLSPSAGLDALSSSSSSSSSSAAAAAASSAERFAKIDKRYLSETEDVDVKKRKKRSTSNIPAATSEQKSVVVSVSPTRKPLSSQESPSNSSIATVSSQVPKRTSTDAKRSKFTKSLSVSTITSEIAPRSQSPIQIRPKNMKKQYTEASSTTTANVDSDGGMGSSSNTSSSSSSANHNTLTTMPEEPRKKRRTETSPGASTGSLNAAAAAATTATTPTTSPKSNGNGCSSSNVGQISPTSAGDATTAIVAATTAPLSDEGGDLAPPHSPSSNLPTLSIISKLELSLPSIRSKSSSAVSSSSQQGNHQQQRSPQHPDHPSSTTTGSQKYALLPSRAKNNAALSSALENSSDYEESEDEPTRHIFYKPPIALLPRDAVPRNLQSTSIRELRSGSFDDMSAREHFVPALPDADGSSPSPGESPVVLRKQHHHQHQHSSPSMVETSRGGTKGSDSRSGSDTITRSDDDLPDSEDSSGTEADSRFESSKATTAEKRFINSGQSNALAKNLDVQLVISTIRRMESDLSLLKRSLADAGIFTS